MIGFLSRLFKRGEPVFTDARPRDAAGIAAIHAASFQRGWGEEEIYGLLIEKSVVAHRATSGGKLIGFILSRRAAGEVWSTSGGRTAMLTSAAMLSLKAARRFVLDAADARKPDCNPNFYLDAQGEKHFKRECFLSH